MNAKSRTENSINNIIFGFLYRIVLIIFPFIIKTILIKKMGIEYLGLNNLFASILQVLSLSELGIGSAMVFAMYKPIANNDSNKIEELLNLYKSLYRKIGIIILVLGVLISPFLDKLINGSIPSDINIYLLYFIYLFNTIISYFLFSYKKSLLEASQQNSVESKINTIISIITYLIQVFVLILWKNYYIYVLFLPISTVALNIVRSIIVDRKFPEYSCKGEIEKNEKKRILKKVYSLIGHRIGTIIITSADNIVISTFIGLEMVAIYGNYYYIVSSLISLFTIFYTSIMASVGNSIITTSKESNKTNFLKFNFMNNWIVGWSTICIVCLIQSFMQIWVGEKLLLDFSIVILMGIYYYSWLFRKIGLTYKDAAGLWNEDFWKPYIGSIFNIITNISLVIIIGLPGVLISTIIVMLFIYFPWETNVIYRNIFVYGKKYYYIKMFKYALVTIAAGFVTYFLCDLFDGNLYIDFIIKIFICLIIPNVIFLLCYFRDKEFKSSLLFIRKGIKR